ncbi:Cholesterol 7-alpha-monooxygenase [Madurella mycetomatis]|uniref:Cholesterol 7-alpha-monooxygenase n=1 Tax=Madurella mycetomatis TaxID=100816 RepID=A0A175W5B1_9PEZI|nr:Cholesterol 7-alpha-monooxygenase [Madurella mycetomatis]
MGLFQHPSQLSELSPLTLNLAVAAFLAVLILLKRVLYPTFDPREPPVLHPKIPFLGHLISIAREASGYYARLYKEHRMPICTLPVLTGKIYVINSPTLISAAMRNKALSMFPFVELFSANALGMSEVEKAKLKDPAYLTTAMQPIHESLMREPLREMARAGLKRIAADLNSVGSSDVPDALGWLRDVICQAVVAAIYGEKNPMTPEVHRHIWEFDKKAAIMTLGIAPKLFARKALAARSLVQRALREFYVAELDQGPDVSAFVKSRAAAKRKLGVSTVDMAVTEFDIPWVSVTNTAPSLVWLFLNIFSRPDYVERLRAEVLEVTTVTGGSATIDALKFEKKAFMNACFQEIQRRYNDAGGNRQVMEDTVLRDVDGHGYLLKKGTNVQWFAGVTQLNGDIWGDDVEAFSPERFVETPAAVEKTRRGAMIPFGGGKHLCPGRMFAVTEISAMIGALALAFDVEDAKLPPVVQSPIPGTSMRQFGWEKGEEPRVKMRRRKGWEDVELRFIV